ncbi:ABC transporter ATP-binding protein [Thermodesulfobacteriota bacterium]
MLNKIPTLDSKCHKPDAATSSAVEITKLNHTFGSDTNYRKVLYDINLTVARGDSITITGPSGSGKTTLLTLIGALRSIQDGSIKILGQELFGLNTGEQALVRRNIGFVFQGHNLFESLSAFQNVMLATELFNYSKAEAKRRAEETLIKLGLGDRMHYKPKKLSGGQKQRVAIGRALVNHPKLVLADEPTAALDPETSKKVMDLFENLTRQEGCTVFIVTQDKRLLDKSQNIITLSGGRLYFT